MNMKSNADSADLECQISTTCYLLGGFNSLEKLGSSQVKVDHEMF